MRKQTISTVVLVCAGMICRLAEMTADTLNESSFRHFDLDQKTITLMPSLQAYGGDRESSPGALFLFVQIPTMQAQVTVDVVRITCEQLEMQALP